MHFNVYFLLYYNVFLHSVITPEVKQKWSLHHSYFITIVDVMVEICSCCSYFFFFFCLFYFFYSTCSRSFRGKYPNCADEQNYCLSSFQWHDIISQCFIFRLHLQLTTQLLPFFFFFFLILHTTISVTFMCLPGIEVINIFFYEID